MKRNDDRMTDRKDGQMPRKEHPGTAEGEVRRKAQDREARLAAALRANLRRRKKGKPAGKAD